jgi:hypothetical protein
LTIRRRTLGGKIERAAIVSALDRNAFCVPRIQRDSMIFLITVSDQDYHNAIARAYSTGYVSDPVPDVQFDAMGRL